MRLIVGKTPTLERRKNYDPERRRFDEYSYQSKYKRKLAARAVRRYRGEISSGGMYRKIFDYVWECW